MKRTSNINTSIVSKISFKFFIATISNYIILNIVVISMFIGYLYVDMKSEVDDIIRIYGKTVIDDMSEKFQERGFELIYSQEEPPPIAIIKNNKDITKMMSFNIVIEKKGSEYRYLHRCVDQEVGLLVKGIFILMLIQALSVFSELKQNRKLVRKTMKPLDELAKAATIINKANDMSPESLRRIAGALESISAEHLEVRLPVESAKDELKALTIAINNMLDRLDKAYKSQATFVSDASHELRTPIAIIQGYANLLDRWGMSEPETATEAINAIKAETQSMKTLVEQLLFLARGENDSMVFETVTIDLGALAEQSFNELKILDSKHKFIFKKDEGAFIKGDVGLIKQLMRILMDNSIKYTPAGDSIWVRVYVENGYSVFSIQDEGQGIASQDVENIFDRFYRADKSRNRNTGGSGLGLTIAKWIVEKHEGKISVLSREGIGTRISVNLLRHEEKEIIK